jgi:hypothetical protein
MARESEDGNRPTASWVSTAAADVDAARAGARQSWRVRWENTHASVFDIVLVLLAVGILDLVLLLLAAWWQSWQCSGTCGLRTQVHLLRYGALFTVIVTALPVLASLLVRRYRAVIAVAQAILLVALLSANVGQQHQKTARINGTAPCWSTQYSNKDCPWGSKD